MGKKRDKDGSKSVKSVATSSASSSTDGVHDLHIPSAINDKYKMSHFAKGKVAIFPAKSEDSDLIPGKLIRAAGLRETEALVVYKWDNKEKVWVLYEAVGFGAWFGVSGEGNENVFKTRAVMINTTGSGEQEKTEYAVRTYCVSNANFQNFTK